MNIFKEISEQINSMDDATKLNIVSKVGAATGLVVTKMSNNYSKESKQYLIEEIKKKEDMPLLAKAAAISNVNKVLKEYINKNDIVNIAMNFLDEESKPEEVDNEWLSYFLS